MSTAVWTQPAKLRRCGSATDGSRARSRSRALDELRRAPPLFPAGPAARRAVEAAERFGHDEAPRHGPAAGRPADTAPAPRVAAAS